MTIDANDADGSGEQPAGRTTVRLGDRLANRVDALVEMGVWETRSEAIREGTRQLVLRAEVERRSEGDDQ